MLCHRIIACLDIKDGKTVKGVNYHNLKDAGDPIELAKKYSLEKIDELVFLDITASSDKRKTVVDLVEKIAPHINIPFTVGGGISTLEDIKTIIYAGADKVSINSSAIYNPKLVEEGAKVFGNQCMVVAIDAKYLEGKWKVFTHGGSKETDYELFDWAKIIENYGAGEIMFTSMDHDGTKNGFAIEALYKLADTVSIPIIASGGAGKIEHFVDLFKTKTVSAALAASVFHFGQIEISELKNELLSKDINVRI